MEFTRSTSGAFASDPLVSYRAHPWGSVALIRRNGIDLAGRHVAVVGRSSTVGRPLANLLSMKAPGCNATVSLLHTGSREPWHPHPHRGRGCRRGGTKGARGCALDPAGSGCRRCGNPPRGGRTAGWRRRCEVRRGDSRLAQPRTRWRWTDDGGMSAFKHDPCGREPKRSGPLSNETLSVSQVLALAKEALDKGTRPVMGRRGAVRFQAAPTVRPSLFRSEGRAGQDLVCAVAGLGAPA